MSADAQVLFFRLVGANTAVLEGVLDEISPPILERLATELGAEKSVFLDVAGVKRINSLGVRAWCGFVKKLSATRTVTFRRCSPAFVEQLNSVIDFRSQAKVESIIAPYFCETTGDVFYEELTIGKDVKKDDFSKLEGRRCERCPKPLIFDDLPERYLHFLAFL
jgi:hypothetical protein